MWGYALDNTRAATQALTATSVVHETLVVTSLDGTANRTIDVTVNGADEPVTNQPPTATPLVTRSGVKV